MRQVGSKGQRGRGRRQAAGGWRRRVAAAGDLHAAAPLMPLHRCWGRRQLPSAGRRAPTLRSEGACGWRRSLQASAGPVACCVDVPSSPGADADTTSRVEALARQGRRPAVERGLQSQADVPHAIDEDSRLLGTRRAPNSSLLSCRPPPPLRPLPPAARLLLLSLPLRPTGLPPTGGLSGPAVQEWLAFTHCTACALHYCRFSLRLWAHCTPSVPAAASVVAAMPAPSSTHSTNSASRRYSVSAGVPCGLQQSIGS